jgi:hypothetical protein
MKSFLRSWLLAARRRLLLAALGLLANLPAAAHEGHGLSEPSHWHATDALVAVAVLIAALWVAKGRKK